MSGYGFSLGGVWMDGVDSMPIVLRGVSGWDDLSDAKTDQERMPGVAGNFDPGETFGDGLPVTVDACAYGTPAECEDLVASVRALRGLARPVEAAFHRRSGVTRRMVEVRAVTGSHESWQSYAEFQVSLLAMDPNAYGEQVSTSCGRPTAGAGLADPLTEPLAVDGDDGDLGRVQFANTGTASTPLLLTVSGGGMTRGVRLRRVETGDTLELAFPLLDGQSCVFDSAAHRVTLDNQSDMTGYLTVDDWFDAPAGGTTTVQFEPLGDVTGEPRLTLTASPAWY